VLARCTQLAVSVSGLGFVDAAGCVAEGVGLCVGVVAYALEAWGEALGVLGVVLVVWQEMRYGREVTLSMSVQRPILKRAGLRRVSCEGK